jgi:hypothetical protein
MTHGRTAYLRGCRCDECRAANAAAKRQWEARRKVPGYVANPKMQKAGKAGAHGRWGEVPRTVSIRHLSDAQRLEVLAFVRLLEKDA